MIPITRVPAPPSLSTEEKVKQLTDEYIRLGKAIWKKSDIVSALLKMGHDKCCYCECKVNEESKYLEVEHFFFKRKYSDMVALWENLLPACKRCNGVKNDLDVDGVSIVNPTIDIPKEHLKMKSYRLRGITEKGKNISKELNLNHTDRLLRKRFEIGNKIVDTIEELGTKVDEGEVQSKTKARDIKRKYVSCLEECQPSKEYSATAIFGEAKEDAIKIRAFLEKHHLRDDELVQLEDIAQKNSLM